MALLVILAVIFYAFLAFAPEDVIKMCLAASWVLMIIFGIVSFIALLFFR